MLSVQNVWAISVDPQKSVSITIDYQSNNMPLVGAEFHLYLVATPDQQGKLKLTDSFSDYPVDLSSLMDSAALALTLEGFVLQDELQPYDSGVTDEQGRVVFPVTKDRLPHGLYLILGKQHIQDGMVYTTQPILVQLPAQNHQGDAFLYDAVIVPKCQVRPEQGEEPKDTVSRKVLKVWEDNGEVVEHPDSIVVYLLCNGKVFDKVKLTKIGNWRHTWDQLDPDVYWSVVEDVPEDYTVKVERKGITFVLTNTYDPDDPFVPEIPITPDSPDTPDTPNTPDTPDTPGTPGTPDTPVVPIVPDEPDRPGKPEPTVPPDELPQTGQLWWPVPLLTVAGLLLIIIGLIRKRGAGYET